MLFDTERRFRCYFSHLPSIMLFVTERRFRCYFFTPSLNYVIRCKGKVQVLFLHNFPRYWYLIQREGSGVISSHLLSILLFDTKVRFRCYFFTPFLNNITRCIRKVQVLFLHTFPQYCYLITISRIDSAKRREGSGAISSCLPSILLFDPKGRFSFCSFTPSFNIDIRCIGKVQVLFIYTFPQYCYLIQRERSGADHSHLPSILIFDA